MNEFAENGLSGARIDEIAAKTRTSKRMIYYYFGDKDGLYRDVLEEAYRQVRAGEENLQLADLEPVAALRKLTEFTFDHHRDHPSFIRMVMIENIHHGDYLKHSEVIRKLNETAISRIEGIYRKGVASGDFRPDLTPLAIHWQISALSFFNVSNRVSFHCCSGRTFTPKRGRRASRPRWPRRCCACRAALKRPGCAFGRGAAATITAATVLPPCDEHDREPAARLLDPHR